MCSLSDYWSSSKPDQPGSGAPRFLGWYNMWCSFAFNTHSRCRYECVYFRLSASCCHSGWQIDTNTVKLRCPTGIAGWSLSLMKTKLTSAITTSVFWCVNGALKRQVRIHFRAGGSSCLLVLYIFYFILFYFSGFLFSNFYFSCIGLHSSSIQ